MNIIRNTILVEAPHAREFADIVDAWDAADAALLRLREKLSKLHGPDTADKIAALQQQLLTLPAIVFARGYTRAAGDLASVERSEP